MCGMQGWRKTMEDAHIALAKVSANEDMALFAVFDGHGGAEVANFCAKYMVPELMKLASFGKGDYDSALKQAFHRIDTMLVDESYANEIASVRHPRLRAAASCCGVQLAALMLCPYICAFARCALPVCLQSR